MAFAADDICCGCVHNLRIQRLLPYWEQAYKAATAASASQVFSVAAAGQQRAQFIKRHVLSEFDEPAT